MLDAELSLSIELLSQERNQTLIFGMDVGDRTGLPSSGNHFEILGGEFIKASHTNHEQFETGMAISNRLCHLVDNFLCRLEDDRMQPIIDDCFVFCLLLPGFDTALDRLPVLG